MNKINSTYKGVLTAALMIALSLGIFYSTGSFDSNLQWLIYLLYAAGILWALLAFKKTGAEKTFKAFFNEGAKCFITVTLLMVVFAFLFIKTHPQFIEGYAAAQRQKLVADGNYMPADIDAKVEMAKKNVGTVLVSMTIFMYLLMGTIITLSASVVLARARAATVNNHQ